jgi:hypothetical protein
MLVTFSTKYYADIVMFGDVGLSMLNMMGQSGTVPGAIVAEDVHTALDKLNVALKAAPSLSEPQEVDDDAEPPVSINKRALPLIELLTVAVKEHSDVMWK